MTRKESSVSGGRHLSFSVFVVEKFRVDYFCDIEWASTLLF